MEMRTAILLDKIIANIKSKENRICFSNLDLTTVKCTDKRE